ncbi:exosortase U [Stieleria sp. TO1_6]|uniref:exosortase U n=1 Tax=Stieleria tagensis TaxID=2956795 RepID=UPI00209A6851|nr:exosortase U [Stieleria tagensis]MCO8125459.1 exosortase U [Stieleria tagensis]
MATVDSTGQATSMPAESPQVDLTGSVEQGPNPLWRWFWLGLFLATAPLLIPYFVNLWGNPTYRYFPFAIAAVGWLAYTRSDQQFYAPRGWLSWAAIGLALFLVVAGTIFQFSLFAAVAMVLIAAAMLHAMRGPDDASLLILVLPLATVVQLLRFDALLVRSLQNVTTWMSSVLLDGIGWFDSLPFLSGFAVPHAVANNIIQLSDRELFVAEACSGIQSVFTLGFLACLVIAVRRRRFWMTPIYLLIACMLAVFANVIRVTVVALAASWYEIDLAHGWSHDLLGYIALAVAAAFLLSFDFLVATVLHRVPEESEFNPVVATWNYFSLQPDEMDGNRGSQRNLAELSARDKQSMIFQFTQKLIQNRTVQGAFVGVMGLLCLASLAQVILSRKPADMVRSDKALVYDPPGDLLDDSLDELTVVGHSSNRGFENPRLGANSDIWECQWDGITAQFVLSQPYQGWHELCDCYERLDWMLLDRDIQSPEDFEHLEITENSSDALKSTYVVARFKRPPSQHAYLLFAGIGSDGTFVDAPDSFAAFTHRVWNRIDTTGVWDQNEVIMLQMWITSAEKIHPRRLQKLEEEFVAVRGRIGAAIAENAGRLVPQQASNHSKPVFQLVGKNDRVDDPSVSAKEVN